MIDMRRASEKADEILDVTFPIAFLVLVALGLVFITALVVAGVFALVTGGLTACEVPQ